MEGESVFHVDTKGVGWGFNVCVYEGERYDGFRGSVGLGFLLTKVSVDVSAKGISRLEINRSYLMRAF